MAKTVKIARKFNTVLAIQEGSGNYKNDLTLKEAAAELGVSRYNLYKNYINTSVDREGLSLPNGKWQNTPRNQLRKSCSCCKGS